MKRLLAIVLGVLAAALLSAQAQSPDDQYVRIYTLMQQADALNEAGQSSQALGKYLEAQTSLKRLQKVFPDWSSKVVSFRLSYLEGKITALTARAPTTATPGGQPPAQAQSPETASANISEADRQLAAVEEQIRQLQADKTVLEAKLKEALATQPAAIDSRELARAEEKIQSLMKENDLLKVAGAKQQGESIGGEGEKALEETRQALVDASRKLSEETERANALALAKESLQKRLDEMNTGSSNGTDVDNARKAIEAANAKVDEQTALANKLAVEKDALQSRLDALSASAGAAEALRAENQILKNQLSELQSKASVASESPEQGSQLARVQAQIAALQSEAEILRLEKTALQDRIKEASVGRDGDARRIKQLERERDDLQKQLNASEKKVAASSRKKANARIKELSEQVESYRARLQVLEAHAVPYTPEELALLRKPETQLVAAGTQTPDKSTKEPPPGTTALAAEAQRLFGTRQFEKAEQKYLEILRHDENSAFTLANLAAIQLEMGRLDEAEKNIKQALASSPDDAYALSILGYLKFRQQKYDDALNALSRAASLSPGNAEVQNYLGVVLSHKGMHDAAEAALRKALVLEPNYASAHNNLAVIYATQQPPLIGLARWHYQKALAAGHPRNEELEKMLDQKSPPAVSQ